MGASIQELADFYGITRQAMWKILKVRGAKFRDNLRYGKDNHFWRGTKASDKAQNILEQAIEDGNIKRETICETCGDSGTFKDGRSKIQAHHPDYGRPLEVMWLCQKCHHEIHKSLVGKEVQTESTGEALRFLRADSRDCANLFPTPESERDETIARVVTSGLKCAELLPSLVHDGSLRRMCRGLLASRTAWYSSKCVLTWKTKVTKSKRLLFQLAVSRLEPRTDGTGCGSSLIKTPSTIEAESENRKSKGVSGTSGTLSQEMASGYIEKRLGPIMLGTPAAADWKGNHGGGQGKSLRTDIWETSRQIAMLPTPNFTGGRTAPDTHKQERRDKGGKCGGDDIATIVGTSRGLRLQPIFCEWMMGYPAGWTNISKE